jgi:gliding motility-associated-like protein
VEVEVLNTSELDLVVESKENVRCTWFDNGSIDVRAVGGDEPYVYVYNGTETSSSGDFTLLPVGDHLIRVEDAVGCVYEEVFALVNDFSNLGNDCPCSIYVPNAFTPDGDLQNEVWEVKASCPVSGFHVQVYDRWGVLVFESMDAAFFWHGGVNGYYLDAELFLYRITYQWGEEENASVETEVQTGYVSILR